MNDIQIQPERSGLRRQADFRLEIRKGSRDPLRIVAEEASRYRGIGRTLRLVAELLKGKKLSRRTAAALLGIEEAAAYRQLTAIADHLPVMTWDTSASPKVLRFERTKLTNPPDFASAIAACFGLSLAPLFRGTQQEVGMRRAFHYVLGETHRRKIFRDIDRKFAFIRRGGEIALPERSEQLDELTEAVLHSRTVRFTYQHFNGEVENLTVKPLSLCIYDHQLYLVADTELRGRYPFRFARIKAIDERDGDIFDYPETAEYNAEQLFADSFGVFVDPRHSVEEIAVKLDSRWATHARSHRWHPSQRIEVLDSGEVMVRLRVRVCPELKAWVRSFGAEAEVVEPPALRKEVAEQLRLAAKRYEGLVS